MKIPANRVVFKYRSPELGGTFTIVFFKIQIVSAILLTVTTAAPDEIPAKIPSSSIRCLAISIVSSDVIGSTWSISSKSRLPEINPAPMP